MWGKWSPHSYLANRVTKNWRHSKFGNYFQQCKCLLERKRELDLMSSNELSLKLQFSFISHLLELNYLFLIALTRFDAYLSHRPFPLLRTRLTPFPKSFLDSSLWDRRSLDLVLDKLGPIQKKASPGQQLKLKSISNMKRMIWLRPS